MTTPVPEPPLSEALLQCLQLLALVAAANTAPLLARRVFKARGAWPVDGGLRFFDGRPLLGHSKTWRGLAAGVLAGALAAPLLGLPPALGARLAAASLAGDLLSSFTKRRLGVPPSGRATGLDQIPEALLPLLALRGELGLAAWQVALVTLGFLVLAPPVAWLAHRIGLREQPY